MAEPERAPKNTSTAQEVAVLIEELRSEFRTVVEISREVRAEVEGLKRWRTSADEKFLQLDFLLIELKKLTEEVRGLKTDLQGFRADLRSSDERLRTVESKVGV